MKIVLMQTAMVPTSMLAPSYAMKAQDQLLNDAMLELRDKTGKHMSAVKAYEVKSLMYSIDEDYDTAICYIRKAMQEEDPVRIVSQTESLIGMLIAIDTTKKNIEDDHIPEAKELIETLTEGEEKKRLIYEVCNQTSCNFQLHS